MAWFRSPTRVRVVSCDQSDLRRGLPAHVSLATINEVTTQLKAAGAGAHPGRRNTTGRVLGQRTARTS
jgi:hypothetical protein